jgi:hypothetical protein
VAGRCDAGRSLQSAEISRVFNLPDNKTMDISGNFLLIAEKNASGLRIKAHTWNVNLPSQ